MKRVINTNMPIFSFFFVLSNANLGEEKGKRRGRMRRREDREQKKTVKMVDLWVSFFYVLFFMCLLLMQLDHLQLISLLYQLSSVPQGNQHFELFFVSPLIHLVVAVFFVATMQDLVLGRHLYIYIHI